MSISSLLTVRQKIIVFSLAFTAIAGLALVAAGNAATFFVGTEAETGVLVGSIKPTQDAAASGGVAVLFGSTTATYDKQFGYSTHILANDTDPQADAYTALASNGGATTVRDDNAFQWRYVETSKGIYDWEASDSLMSFAARHNLHVLMLTDTIASWSNTSDAVGFGDFVGKLAARYGPNGSFWSTNPTLPRVYPAGIEIWNEENVDDSMPPAIFTPLIKSAYTAVRKVYPAPGGIATMPIILGGLAPSGAYNDAECTGATNNPIASWGDINPLNYLELVYKAGGGGSFDAVGWHPYSYAGGDTANNIMEYDRCSAWSQMNETHMRNSATASVVSLMQQYGDGAKKIWITETGAPTCMLSTTSSYPCISEGEQSKLASLQVAAWKSYSWAGNFYWYSVRDDDGGDDPNEDQEHFGVIRGNSNSVANGGPGSQKPAYLSLKAGYTSP